MVPGRASGGGRGLGIAIGIAIFLVLGGGGFAIYWFAVRDTGDGTSPVKAASSDGGAAIDGASRVPAPADVCRMACDKGFECELQDKGRDDKSAFEARRGDYLKECTPVCGTFSEAARERIALCLDRSCAEFETCTDRALAETGTLAGEEAAVGSGSAAPASPGVAATPPPPVGAPAPPAAPPVPATGGADGGDACDGYVERMVACTKEQVGAQYWSADIENPVRDASRQACDAYRDADMLVHLAVAMEKCKDTPCTDWAVCVGQAAADAAVAAATAGAAR